MGAMESIASNLTCAAKREKDRDLKGRVVLITGTSKGMGHYMAKVLAGKGARVIAVARSVAPEWVDLLKHAARTGGGELHALTCDISSLNDVISLYSEKLPKLDVKTIDVLINNAGIMPCFAKDPVSTPDGLEEATIRTNVDGTHFMTKYALKTCWSQRSRRRRTHSRRPLCSWALPLRGSLSRSLGMGCLPITPRR